MRWSLTGSGWGQRREGHSLRWAFDVAYRDLSAGGGGPGRREGGLGKEDVNLLLPLIVTVGADEGNGEEGGTEGRGREEKISTRSDEYY